MGYYEQMTKAQLIDKCEGLEEELIALRKRNEITELENTKLKGEKTALNARLTSVEEELGVAKDREKKLWRVVNRIMDVEEFIDDLEDAAEDLREAYEENKKHNDD